MAARPVRLAAGVLLFAGLALFAGAAVLSRTELVEAAFGLLILALPATSVGGLLWWLESVDARSRAGDRSHHRPSRRRRRRSSSGDGSTSRFTSSMMMSPSEFGPLTRTGRAPAPASSFDIPTRPELRPDAASRRTPPPVVPQPAPITRAAPLPLPLPPLPGGNALLFRGAAAGPLSLPDPAAPPSADTRPLPSWGAANTTAATIRVTRETGTTAPTATAASMAPAATTASRTATAATVVALPPVASSAAAAAAAGRGPLVADADAPTWTVDGLRALPPARLQALVRVLYRQVGFRIRLKPLADGSGQQLWLYSRHHRGPPVSVVQCVSQPGVPLAEASLRDLAGLMVVHGARRGHCVAVGGFSAGAQLFAGRNGMHLIDLPSLHRVIASRTPLQQRELQAAAQASSTASAA